MNLRILFVEKDATTADLLVPSLKRKGHQVMVAHSQSEAMRCMRPLCPNLLVVDVASFGRRGYEMRDALCDRLQGVPTVLLLEKGHEWAGSSAEAFMTPPFTSRKLLHRIKKAAKHVISYEIQVGPLTLDPETRTLYRGKRSWQLRPTEAELLALFLRNPGKTLSRREIMRHVWNTDYVEDTRTLNVHVCWLRRKIEDNPSHPRLLRTVRGVGYCFVGSSR